MKRNPARRPACRVALCKGDRVVRQARAKRAGNGKRTGQESLTVGSWRPLSSEVHGLVSHGQAVRSFFQSTSSTTGSSIRAMWCGWGGGRFGNSGEQSSHAGKPLQSPMRILFIGDIVGSSGRQIVRDRLADL